MVQCVLIISIVTNIIYYLHITVLLRKHINQLSIDLFKITTRYSENIIIDYFYNITPKTVYNESSTIVK